MLSDFLPLTPTCTHSDSAYYYYYHDYDDDVKKILEIGEILRMEPHDYGTTPTPSCAQPGRVIITLTSDKVYYVNLYDADNTPLSLYLQL